MQAGILALAILLLTVIAPKRYNGIYKEKMMALMAMQKAPVKETCEETDNDAVIDISIYRSVIDISGL